MNDTPERAVAHLEAICACTQAVRYVQENKHNLERAYVECERGDWLLWWAGKIGLEPKRVVTVACQCARTVLEFVPDGEARPRKAIETAEAWVRDEATIEEVRKAAAYAAYAADDARTKKLAQCADLVRAEVPWGEVAKALEKFNET